MGGRPASSAYAIPCGTSRAVRTSPATTSFVSQARSYVRRTRMPGTDVSFIAAEGSPSAPIRLAGGAADPGGRSSYRCSRMRDFCCWNSSSVSAPFSRRSESRSSSVTTDGDPPCATGRRDTVGVACPLLVLLSLDVDHLLHGLRLADRPELLPTGLRGGLDHQGPGSDHAIQHRLLEPNVVDRLERDVHRASRHPAFPMDDAIGRHHEVRRHPPHQPPYGIGDQDDREPGQDDPVP